MPKQVQPFYLSMSEFLVFPFQPCKPTVEVHKVVQNSTYQGVEMSSRGHSHKRKSTGAIKAKGRQRSSSLELCEQVSRPMVADNSKQGIVNRPPLVEEVFDISTILNDSKLMVHQAQKFRTGPR